MVKDYYDGLILGILIGLFIGSSLFLIVDCLIYSHVDISHETANDICYNFTGVRGATAVYGNYKLICEVPTFDSTQNIIIKTNGEK